tara:strand:+ start:124 stop:417 length:294 start_codon:yes stop_codon:yes gene_type:complete
MKTIDFIVDVYDLGCNRFMTRNTYLRIEPKKEDTPLVKSYIISIPLEDLNTILASAADKVHYWPYLYQELHEHYHKQQNIKSYDKFYDTVIDHINKQ